MWNKFSIKVQLILFMTLVVTVVELSTLLMIHHLQKIDAHEKTILEVDTITKSLNNDILKFILNPSTDMLSDITYRLSAFKKIRGFVLYDNTNQAIFQYANTTKLLDISNDILDKKIIFEDKNLFIKKEIVADNYTFGFTLLDIDLSQYIKQQEFVTYIFLGIFPISLLLGLIMSLFLSQSYTKPFKKLINAMKDSDPTKNEIIEIHTTSKNEIKELFDGFNNQMKHIRMSTREIEQLSLEIEETQKEVVFTMGSIGETRSKETGNHVKRVAQYSKIFALHYGLNKEDAEMLKQASPMHDIGKIGIPDNILNKPGRFDESERLVMDTHAKLGYEMLKTSNRPLLKMAATVAYEHHEKWDGTGYPNKIKGEDISIYGRITAIADVFDALGSDRVYKQAWSDEKIFKLFKEERSKHFDPKLVDIFFNHIDEFLEIRKQFKDAI